MNSAAQVFLCRVLGQCYEVNEELAPTLPEMGDPYWLDRLCTTTGICITPAPTNMPSSQPSRSPSSAPSIYPSALPSTIPSSSPTAPTVAPSSAPTALPSVQPSSQPTTAPSSAPSEGPRVTLFGLRGENQRPICRFLISC